MTVLVSTHYMDEAERCHEIAYIAYGELLAQGTVDEVIAQCASRRPIRSRGPDTAELAAELEARPASTWSRRSARACMSAAATPRALDAATRLRGDGRRTLDAGEPTLEDVFIDLMSQAKDNAHERRHRRAAHADGSRAVASRICADLSEGDHPARRDRITFAMMIVIPLVQLLLFGYAINTNPKHLPTARADPGRQRLRALLPRRHARDGLLQHRRASVTSEDELDRLLLSGRVQFGVQIPTHFGRDLMRGERPALLVVADATDPSATGSAVAALEGLAQSVFTRDSPARRTSRRSRLPSNCACIAATIRRSRRASTSCPA